ncbi:hypothetical protein CO704_06465 [Cedecea neteri]|uniref:Uncharacterized protein n=1 Tax=Cedecea neteri TaxID=158822 RepID=A0A291DVJ9_9ENTR|nr:hypothetical protein CO704_06465 [Cedecea neteri]
MQPLIKHDTLSKSTLMMGKLYSTTSGLTVIDITKIALPITITRFCDSAIKLQSLC